MLLLLLLLTEPPAVHLREQMNGEERLIKWVTRTQVAFLGNAVRKKRSKAGGVQLGGCTCLQLGQESSDPPPHTHTPREYRTPTVSAKLRFFFYFGGISIASSSSEISNI